MQSRGQFSCSWDYPWSPTSGIGAPSGRRRRRMFNGGGQNRFSWKTPPDPGRRGHHVVALDTCGPGDSDRAPGADYAVETPTTDATRRRGDRPPCGGGRGQHGGLTGILIAERAGPQTVNGLVLVDVVPRYETGQRPYPGLHVGAISPLQLRKPPTQSPSISPPHRDKPRSPEGLKGESAPARRTPGTGTGIRAYDDRAHPCCAPRTSNGRAGPDDPGPVDSRKAVRRGQFRRDFLAMRPTRSSSNCPTCGAHRRDDNDAFTDVVVDFNRRL